MPAMDEVLAARRAARASRSQGRLNVVAVFILLISLVIGLVMTAGSQNPGTDVRQDGQIPSGIRFAITRNPRRSMTTARQDGQRVSSHSPTAPGMLPA